MKQINSRMRRIGCRIGFSNPYDTEGSMFIDVQGFVVGVVGVFARMRAHLITK